MFPVHPSLGNARPVRGQGSDSDGVESGSRYRMLSGMNDYIYVCVFEVVPHEDISPCGWVWIDQGGVASPGD